MKTVPFSIPLNNPLAKISPEEGTIFMEPGIVWTYLAIFWITFFAFFVVIYGWKFFFDFYKSQDENYTKQPEMFKWLYVQNWAGNTHHIIVSFYCFYNVFTLKCDDKHHLIASMTGDDVCLMRVQKECVYGIVFTMGYLCYDLIIQVFYC